MSSPRPTTGTYTFSLVKSSYTYPYTTFLRHYLLAHTPVPRFSPKPTPSPSLSIHQYYNFPPNFPSLSTHITNNTSFLLLYLVLIFHHKFLFQPICQHPQHPSTMAIPPILYNKFPFYIFFTLSYFKFKLFNLLLFQTLLIMPPFLP